MRVAAAIELTDAERTALLKWSRGRSTPARLVPRARIVLAAAAGTQNTEIAVALNCRRETVARWRHCFAGQPAGQRLTSLEQDAPRTGHRPVTRLAHEAEVLCKTTQETPPCATRWLTRTMANSGGCSKVTVQHEDGAAHLARQRPEAIVNEDLRGVQRSTVRGEAGRCRGFVPESTRACAGAHVR